MTDTFHQEQVKKMEHDVHVYVNETPDIHDERCLINTEDGLDGGYAATECCFTAGITRAMMIEQGKKSLTSYGQALREDMREYGELMGYEYAADHMDDLGIPPKETDATPECGDANCFDPGCTKPKETELNGCNCDPKGEWAHDGECPPKEPTCTKQNIANHKCHPDSCTKVNHL